MFNKRNKVVPLPPSVPPPTPAPLPVLIPRPLPKAPERGQDYHIRKLLNASTRRVSSAVEQLRRDNATEKDAREKMKDIGDFNYLLPSYQRQVDRIRNIRIKNQIYGSPEKEKNDALEDYRATLARRQNEMNNRLPDELFGLIHGFLAPPTPYIPHPRNDNPPRPIV